MVYRCLKLKKHSKKAWKKNQRSLLRRVGRFICEVYSLNMAVYVPRLKARPWSTTHVIKTRQSEFLKKSKNNVS